MAVNFGIRIEADATNASDLVRSEALRKFLAAVAQSGQTTALSLNDTWASGGTPSLNINCGGGTVDWHIEVKYDTAVVTDYNVGAELIQKMLAIGKEMGLTLTLVLATFTDGGTADASVLLT